MKYKLLALDMDGTTLNSEKKISANTFNAISELIKSGVQVVLSTGRGLAELVDYAEELKLMSYGILISGGFVYDFKKAQPISIHPVQENLLLELIEQGLEEKAMIHIITAYDSITNRDYLDEIKNFRMEVYEPMYRKIMTDCKDFKKFIRENPGEVIKINLYHRSIESRQKTFERFKNSDITFSYAEETSLEACPKNITKASGLIELCNFLKINLSETVAVGDAPNDLEILQTAGVAAVMGNASDEIKKIADFVTADNDHDGVVKVIQKYF